MIPDFFIVGATKCGTYTLYEYLNSLSEIEMSKDKEPGIITDGIHLPNMSKEYAKQFSDKYSLKGECDANNLVVGYVPDRIKLLNPNAKIIILTRDPAERAFSHWSYMRNLRPGLEIDYHEAFEENFRSFDLEKFSTEEKYNSTRIKQWGNYQRMYLETGCYDYYIRKYLDFQLLVLDISFLEEDREEFFRSVCDFLNVRYVRNKSKDRNVSKNKDATIDIDFIRGFYDNCNIRY